MDIHSVKAGSEEQDNTGSTPSVSHIKLPDKIEVHGAAPTVPLPAFKNRDIKIIDHVFFTSHHAEAHLEAQQRKEAEAKEAGTTKPSLTPINVPPTKSLAIELSHKERANSGDRAQEISSIINLLRKHKLIRAIDSEGNDIQYTEAPLAVRSKKAGGIQPRSDETIYLIIPEYELGDTPEKIRAILKQTKPEKAEPDFVTVPEGYELVSRALIKAIEAKLASFGVSWEAVKAEVEGAAALSQTAAPSPATPTLPAQPAAKPPSSSVAAGWGSGAKASKLAELPVIGIY